MIRFPAANRNAKQEPLRCIHAEQQDILPINKARFIMRNKTIQRFIIRCGLLFLPLLAVYLLLGRALVYKHPVDSHNVLLEGWMLESVIKNAPGFLTASETERIIIASMNNAGHATNGTLWEKAQELDKASKQFTLASNSMLRLVIPAANCNPAQQISFKMKGSRDDRSAAHYAVFFNDSLLAHGFAKEEFIRYRFQLTNWETEHENELMICFDNDACSSTGDRNLYISRIQLDTMNASQLASSASCLPARAYPQGAAGPVFNLRNIQSLLLADMGCDTSKIRWISAEPAGFNKTKAYAQAASEFLNASSIESINLVTAEKHSRRSFINFRAQLKKEIELGCVPVENKVKNPFINTIDERISLLFTWSDLAIKEAITRRNGDRDHLHLY